MLCNFYPLFNYEIRGDNSRVVTTKKQSLVDNMKIFKEDIIVALATPPGEGAISVIRLSGEGCAELADKVFRGSVKLTEAKPNTIHYGRIVNTENETIDDVLISVFKAPHSYTGEDSIEISAHGNPLIVEKIISLLLEKGARAAEPGEFTLRAFLSGRIDLAQAEAVADVISSRTEASLRGARNQLDGLLSQKINSMRESLLEALSLTELELDFAEEDLEFLPYEELEEKIKKIIEEIDKLLATYSFGKVIRDGINVAIVGKPNVGKSSLLNYFLKEQRAIVSETPGTTRDVIREELNIDGFLFKLFDTAGIRETSDNIEKEGVLRSRKAIEDADVVLFLNDATEGFDEDLYEKIIEFKPEESVLVVFNKTDIAEPQARGINISAKTGKGIDELLSELKNRALGSKTYSEKTAIVSNARHYKALRQAKKSLESAVVSIRENMTQEFISVDLRAAAEFLDEIIGKVTTDDILNNIFDKFCIGK